MANVVCPSSRVVRLASRLFITLFVLCALAGTASAQTTVTLSTRGTQINADLYVQGGGYGNVDFSSSPVLASKVSSESYTRRIFLKMNTQDYVPANAVIQSAQLYLTLSKAESGENRPFTAFYVSRSFVTGQTDWYYFRDGQPWSTPGGDLGANYGTTYVGGAVGSTYKFDVTKLVQATVNGEFGSRYTRLALIDTGGAGGGNYREFYSTRASDSSVRPRLVITYGGSASTSTTTTTTPTPPPPTTTSSTSTSNLRVMQWNVHKTMGEDGVCNPDRTATVIAAQNPDVVSLNEVNFYSGTCAWSFDMGQKLEGLLEQKTGVNWYRQSVNAGGVGNVLLSRIAPAASGSQLVDYGRGVAQMTLLVNGRYVNVFSFHAEYDTAWWRPIQISEALDYLNNFSEPRIIMGDFNTNPGTSDYYLAANPLQDAWAAAQSAGTAWSYNGTGMTHGGSRFDYAFYSRVQALALYKVTVPDCRVNGVFASDHDPVVSTFIVK